MLGNVDRVSSLMASASSTVSATTAPDRSEVAVVSSGLAASFGPVTTAP